MTETVIGIAEIDIVAGKYDLHIYFRTAFLLTLYIRSDGVPHHLVAVLAVVALTVVAAVAVEIATEVVDHDAVGAQVSVGKIRMM